MRQLKKIIAVLLVLCMVAGLAACGTGNNVAPVNNAANSAVNNDANNAENGAGNEAQAAYPERDVDYPTEIPLFGEDSVQIHYQRDNNKYSGWTLWLWNPDGQDDSKEDDFNYQDDYGVIAAYPLSKFGVTSSGRLGIIVKTKGSWTKDGTDSDRFIVFSNLQKDENGVYHIYLAGGDENMYKSSDKKISDSIDSAVFRDEKTIRINCSNATEHYKIFEDGTMIAEGGGAGRSTFSANIPESADFAKKYTVEIEFRESGAKMMSDVAITGLYSSDSFNEKYYYDGELGAIYTKAATTFRVWSPVSEKIELKIYDSGDEGSADGLQTFEMEKKDKGVFEYIAAGDMEGKYYTYVVYNSRYPDGKEIVDPYARSAGASGMRGMVVDFAKTNPDGWNAVQYLSIDRKKLTVWEMHIADITSSPTWTGSEANRRKYLGVVESGTTYTEGDKTVSTGFDHIIELGVNAVQLLPVFDQANNEKSYTFNWGYNPLNYNVPEGLYSSDPSDGYARIRELKQLIMEFNKKGITVIMDVVYNHVNGAEGSNFDVLMPGYYYRYNLDGSLSNGSGCGNETASENAMVRKFIIDSICFWTKEYKLGGFRFDLMGLHDIETMNEAAAAAKKINSSIVIYGEPWTGGGTTLPEEQRAIQKNANEFVGYGQFNDQMRDALIKGGLNAKEATGWVTGTTAVSTDIDAIKGGINGYTVNSAYKIEDADKTVNYVTCHDNYTLYDRCKAAGITDEETIRKMCLLANAVVFTSDGTTFMLSGEEMLRTKGGDSNSYQSPDDVNALDYSLKIKNADVFENYKKLIAFKQSVSGLSTGAGNIEVNVSADLGMIWYTVKGADGEYLVIHANGKGTSESVDTKGYTLLLDTLGKLTEAADTAAPEKYQTLIFKK